MSKENSQESQTEPTQKRRWKRWVAVVLCLLFAVFSTLAWNRLHIPLSYVTWIPKMQWGAPSQDTKEMRSAVLIGHRGMGLKPTAEASKEGVKYIGNTMEALRGGFEVADWVEVDVQCSAKDADERGKLFLFHDKKLSPKTNSAQFSEIHKKQIASECTWEELQKLTLNVSTGDKKIVSLDDAFDEAHQPSGKWIFDVKQKGIQGGGDNAEQESQQKLLPWINRKVDEGRLKTEDVIIFGEYEILKEYAPSDFALGYTTLFSENIFRAMCWPHSFVDRAKELGCEYLVLPIGFAEKDLIEHALGEKLEVWVYGTENQEEIEFLMQCGVTGFIVDEPGRKWWLRP